jgi:hypothetical protein
MAPRVGPKHHADFQWIINQDDQEIQFIITNLCHEDWVKIDIMKTNSCVHDVNFNGINMVNELPPLQSWLNEVDQTTSKTMILSPIIDEQTCERLSVGTAEAINPDKPQGIYFYIAVTPKNTLPSLYNKFKDTMWVCDDMVVIRQPYIPPLFGGIMGIPYHHTEFFGNVPWSPPVPPRKNDMPPPLPPRKIDIPAPPAMDCIPQEMVSYSSTLPVAMGFIHDPQPSTEQLEFQKTSEQIVKASIASFIRDGRYIKEETHHTDFGYNYDVSSNRDGHLCCISLSIHKDLRFVSELNWNELRNIGTQMIQSVTEKKSAMYLEEITKIYGNDECPICFGETVDAVLYTCGHTCCKECANQVTVCPYCRKHISCVVNNFNGINKS